MKNEATNNLKVAQDMVAGEYPDVEVPQGSGELLSKLSGEVKRITEGLKECRRQRQLALSKDRREKRKREENEFRAAAIAATFTAKAQKLAPGTPSPCPSPCAPPSS